MTEVAVIGSGQTDHGRKRDDVSQPELVRQAVALALADAAIEPERLDAVVISNMELFEGRALPELWLGEGAYAARKPCLKVATGGTSGTSSCIAGYHQVASGLFDVVLVVGFEKHSEGHTQTGMALTDPFWDRAVAAGALGNFALSISQYMAERGVTQEQAARVAVKARRNAARNPHAHLQMPDITVEEVLASKLLAHPVHLLDMCPQSDGAAAIVLAGGQTARRLCPRPAWIKAAETRHEQPFIGDIDRRLASMRTLREAARSTYAKAGIADPLRDLDVAEIYEPVSYAELAWYEALGFCADGEAGRLIDEGVTEMDGTLPVNPSGGVLSANPVGASGVIRVAEAAKQVLGRAGEHQVAGVETALATGYGVYAWADALVLGATP
ncbi:MAG TPA: thiolase family protein [Alphaproteobacteria bacterium]|jgi:acetyl-CoA C-acetyltransferase|nr:thiolase family protein [Alphaproteobacteria bacterium]MDP7427006.1 thiolase family protein [Alphaproteobacteria bacterium]HJM50289.1 thiolase family protein [Alphaproteobacteria bacterium]